MGNDLSRKIKIIGLTGRSGSGKTTAGRYLNSIGEAVIDCDETAHNILRQSDMCRQAVAEHFGRDLLENGQINRAKLAKRAFETPDAARALTDITHPYITESILKTADDYEKTGVAYVYVDGAVIIGGEFEKYCDKIIVVAANERDSIERLKIRDSLSAEKLKERLSRQLSLQKMLERADYIICNNSDIEAFYAEIRRVNNVLKELYGEKKG